MGNNEKAAGSKTVMIVSSFIVGIFVILGIVMPETLKAAADVCFAFLTGKFGWFYLLTVFVMLIFTIALGISKYGNIKLGKDEDKPEFSNFKWFTMLFGGGMGIGLVFWSVAEPLCHYMAPPSAVAGTPDAMYEAMEVVFFHWGIHPWMIYAIGGLGLGYFAFRKDRPMLVSSALEPLIGLERVRGGWGKAVDILAVIATIFGIATSLGLGAGQIIGGLTYVYGVEGGTMITVALIGVITLLFTIATVSGLQKGMQLVADIKIYLSIAFMIFIFIFGGAVFVLDIFTNTIGTYFGNIIARSLFMENSSFIQGWTVFYWAWWIAWAPFCGQFVARVSRGRTIRQYIFAVMLLPAGFGFVWLAIYGGAAFNIDATVANGAIQAAVGESTQNGLFALLQYLPGYKITAPLAMLLIVFCFLGAANSATYVLSMLTDNGNLDPSKKMRAGWGIAQGAVTAVCIIIGGSAVMSILQTVSIVAAFPYLIVMILLCISIFIALKQEFNPEFKLFGKKKEN